VNRDPRALLDAVLAAFRDGDDPATPAARLWDVATPRFRSRLRGPEHLADLFANPAWAPLLGHRSADVESFDAIDGAARAALRVEARDGTVVRYLASLARDADGGSWRVSGLVRAELADA
jgi:hypothetical protein